MSRHGTHAGWAEHQRLGERPCDPCYAAKAEYDKRWRAAPERKRRDRLMAKAQAKALSRLMHRYPDEYRVLYEEAKQEFFAASAPDGAA